MREAPRLRIRIDKGTLYTLQRSDDLYPKSSSHAVLYNATHYLTTNSTETHVPSLSGNITRPSLFGISVSVSGIVRGRFLGRAGVNARVGEADGVSHVENEGKDYDGDKSDGEISVLSS